MIENPKIIHDYVKSLAVVPNRCAEIRELLLDATNAEVPIRVIGMDSKKHVHIGHPRYPAFNKVGISVVERELDQTVDLHVFPSDIILMLDLDADGRHLTVSGNQELPGLFFTQTWLAEEILVAVWKAQDQFIIKKGMFPGNQKENL